MRALTKCIHFSGVINPCCYIGISYETVRDKKGLACLSENNLCSKRAVPTPEQVTEDEKQAKEDLEGLMLTMAAVTEAAKGKRTVGNLTCPKCKKGTLHWRIASNGHASAICSTPHCTQWIQ